MQSRYIPAVTMLSAGAVVSIFCIVKKVDVLYSLKLLLAMLILFYLIGLIAKRIIGKIQEEAEKAYEERMHEEEQMAAELKALQENGGNDEDELETEVESEEESQGKNQ